MQPWYDSDPERLSKELAALDAAGIEYSIDDDYLKDGRLRLHLVFQRGLESYKLVADYPDLFPYFQPEAAAIDRTFVRHQHPQGGNLCLLGRRTDQWKVDDTLANLLLDQFVRIIEYDESLDEQAVKAVEEPQGEPASEYFNAAAAPESFVLFDGEWAVPDKVDCGQLVLWFYFVPSKSSPVGVPRAIVGQILDERGRELAKWTGPRPKTFNQTMRIRWVRVDPPPVGTLPDLVARLTESQRTFLWGNTKIARKSQRGISAVLFREEIQQFVYGDGWSFFLEYFSAKKGTVGTKALALRSYRAGEADLSARMPAVAALNGKHVALVGLGALGSSTAIHLARSGIGQLTLVDYDFMEPATARRWAVGWPAFGSAKGEALKSRVELDYPWTEVALRNEKIGAAAEVLGSPSQRETIGALVMAADLVIDCTAELGVNHYLSAACRANARSYILANATPGAWGGMVAQFVPERKSACWMCLRHDLYGEPGADDLPASDPEGLRQPPGCAARTFTGSSFDLEEVALETVRVSCGVLAGETGYPPTTWDLNLLDLRNLQGERIPPAWTGRSIAPQVGCECQSF